MTDIKEMVEDHHWFPLRFDHARRRLLLVRLDRNAHRQATFLDASVLANQPPQVWVGLDQIAEHWASPPTSGTHFIFHTAFCCSTLLARAMDVEGASMGLKEPAALNDLAGAALQGAAAPTLTQARESLLNLLGRPFSRGEAVVIKPSNVVNPLIQTMVGTPHVGRALFLSSSLEDFLYSIAKKGLFGRVWARRSLATRWQQTTPASPLSASEKWELSDLQVAGLLWIEQRVEFARLLKTLSVARAATLDSEQLLSDPSRVLTALSAFFELGLESDQIEALVSGPIFHRDSKRHEEVRNAARRNAEREQSRTAVGEEVAMVTTWADKLIDHFGIEVVLRNGLLADRAAG